MRLSPLLIFALASVPALAQQLPSMYGIQLGEPLNLMECARKVFLGRWEYSTINITSTPCFQRSFYGTRTPETPMLDENVAVVWPVMKGPDIAASDSIGVMLVGGRSERIEIRTRGASDQNAAFDQLLGKFGKPSSSDTRPVQNRMGAKFEAIIATWKGQDFTVQLLGMVGRIDEGYIIIETPSGRAAHADQQQRLFGNKPKM